jgi:hypothetical protein
MHGCMYASLPISVKSIEIELSDYHMLDNNASYLVPLYLVVRYVMNPWNKGRLSALPNMQVITKDISKRLHFLTTKWTGGNRKLVFLFRHLVMRI